MNSKKPDGGIEYRTCSNSVQCWSDWSDCSVTCGEIGYRSRKRLSVSKNITDKDQTLSSKNDFVIQRDICAERLVCPPVWSEWTTCTKDCGGGTSDRVRQNRHHCFGNETCENELERKKCNIIPCDPIWSEWSDCEIQDCDKLLGIQRRSRLNSCFGNFNCENHDSFQNQTCQIAEDSKIYRETCGIWTAWSSCVVNCQDPVDKTQKFTTTRQRLGETEVKTCYDCEKPPVGSVYKKKTQKNYNFKNNMLDFSICNLVEKHVIRGAYFLEFLKPDSCKNLYYFEI